MKLNKYLCLTLISVTCLTSPILADDDIDVDTSDFAEEQIDAPTKRSSPFSFTARLDNVQSTDIKSGFYKEDSVRFCEGEIEGGMVFYYSPKHQEAANVTISYTSTLIKWDHNPWCSQDHFKTVTVTLGGASKRFCRWTWRGQVGISVDAEEWDLSEYSYYDALLWGRYEYCNDIGVHIGLLAQTGMLMDRVYPILGVDWQITDKWKANLVFPVNISFEYTINHYWKAALAVRTFDSRHRIGKHECHSKALIRYENVGVELAAIYEFSQVSVNVHGGYTLGGKLRVANRHNDHPHHYKLESAPYAGIEAVISF